MPSNALRVGVFLLIGIFALGTGGCGKKKKKKKDPVATAMATPGVRTVVIPKQRNDVTVVVTPCTSAAVQQPGAKRKPPGSNELVVPKGTLTQTVAVPPCPAKPTEMAANTVLITPGGTGSAQQETPPQDQLVLPDNSDVRTIIIPPCATATKASKKKSLAFPATSAAKSVTAPPCKAPPPA
ncbi:MAG: hypothetical protein M3401_15245 [Actinomycetota bacterium]|nr:hypothetical protein [Actinomycetota bacterium]